MELGNLFCGNSRGEYPLNNRDLVNGVWQELISATKSDFYGYTKNKRRENYRGGYENDVFCIYPYWWGDEDSAEADKPNFIYKPTRFEIQWYKYPFRDSYMNYNIPDDEIELIFRKCIESVKK